MRVLAADRRCLASAKRRASAQLAVSLALWLAGTGWAQEPAAEPGGGTPDREYFVYQGEPRYLTVVDGRVAVHHSPEDTEAARAEVQQIFGGELALESGSSKWSLFAQDSASGEADGLAIGSTARVSPRGRDLVQRLLAALTGRPYVFSPVLRHDDGGEVTFGGEITAGFDPSLGEDSIEEEIARVGGTVLEGRFRTLHTIYRFSIAALQSGFDVLATANDFASRPGVDWAEPSFIYLNPQPASTCIPLSPSPTSSELSKNWWDDGTWGINVSGAWAECGGESAPGQPLIRLGVIGDGVDLTHPDLYKLGPTIPGKGFVSAHPSAASGEPW